MDESTDGALIDHVAGTTGLTTTEATRVVADVLAFHAEPIETYVRRRHSELQQRGGRNQDIFARLAAELSGRVVAAPVLSERQLRRIVYG